VRLAATNTYIAHERAAKVLIQRRSLRKSAIVGLLLEESPKRPSVEFLKRR